MFFGLELTTFQKKQRKLRVVTVWLLPRYPTTHRAITLRRDASCQLWQTPFYILCHILSLYVFITELEYRCGEERYQCFNGDDRRRRSASTSSTSSPTQTICIWPGDSLRRTVEWPAVISATHACNDRRMLGREGRFKCKEPDLRSVLREDISRTILPVVAPIRLTVVTRSSEWWHWSIQKVLQKPSFHARKGKST